MTTPAAPTPPIHGQRHHDQAITRTRSPHDPPGYVPEATLLQWWREARTRTFNSDHGLRNTPTDLEDLWTELAVGTRLATEITAGRGCVVARLLRAGGVATWHQVGNALGMTGDAAAAGFQAWIDGQVNLFRRTGHTGLTRTEAATLTRLARAVGSAP